MVGLEHPSGEATATLESSCFHANPRDLAGGPPRLQQQGFIKLHQGQRGGVQVGGIIGVGEARQCGPGGGE